MSTWVIGIGCRRGVSVEQIHAAVFAALGTRPLASIRALASIDSKNDETALLEFAARHGLPLQFFSKQRVAQIGTGASERVQALLGIDGVCEPCALLASRNGRIIVPKTVTGGVTVAIAEDTGGDTAEDEPINKLTTRNIMKTDEESHLRMTQRRKEGHEKKQAAAAMEKGLLIVNTGTGKGKTTAAFGMAVRVLGHGMRLGVVQFIKGALHTSERDFLGAIANCDFITMGDGYTWDTQNRDADIATARKGWDAARKMIESGEYQMVVLDELCTVLKYEYLPLDEVLAVLTARPEMLHVVVTGRHAPEALIEAADLVTEMRPIKHPYREQGVKAQRGVEF
jgi:cob(I)alamin adenosyltransferase